MTGRALPQVVTHRQAGQPAADSSAATPTDLVRVHSHNAYYAKAPDVVRCNARLEAQAGSAIGLPKLPERSQRATLLGVKEMSWEEERDAVFGCLRVGRSRLELADHQLGERYTAGPRPPAWEREPSDGLEPSTPSLPWRCSTN